MTGRFLDLYQFAVGRHGKRYFTRDDHAKVCNYIIRKYVVVIWRSRRYINTDWSEFRGAIVMKIHDELDIKES